MTNFSFLMGYEIKTQAGSILKPKVFNLWNQNSQFAEYTPHSPLKFHHDSLIGLQFHAMTDFKYLQNKQEQLFIEDSINALCPYSLLMNNSTKKLTEIFQKFPLYLSQSNQYQLAIDNFEQSWNLFWAKNDFSQGIDFQIFHSLFQMVHTLEEEINSPLIYNFKLNFSSSLHKKLLHLYSFLFHLRSLMALDHNMHIEDSSFESIKCDSISDYLSRADFTTNDAIIYWQFKKLATPFIAHKDKDVRIEQLFVLPLQRAFDQYSHNASCLIDNLPTEFLNQHLGADLENELYQLQMNWLLGSSAGLLFRIREELYGLLHGYEKIFWVESSTQKIKTATQFKVCFELSENDLQFEDAA